MSSSTKRYDYVVSLASRFAASILIGTCSYSLMQRFLVYIYMCSTIYMYIYIKLIFLYKADKDEGWDLYITIELINKVFFKKKK